jgi:hypothetical protein
MNKTEYVKLKGKELKTQERMYSTI